MLFAVVLLLILFGGCPPLGSFSVYLFFGPTRKFKLILGRAPNIPGPPSWPGQSFTHLGSPDAVGMAEHAVLQLLDKGYMSLQYEDYEEDGVQVHPSLFPALIGKEGAVIQDTMHKSGQKGPKGILLV